MKIAILISGLVRYPYHGYSYLKDLISRSSHSVDIFVAHWDNNPIPDDIIEKPLIKEHKSIPRDILSKLWKSVDENCLSNRELDQTRITQVLPGFIAHLCACTVFEKELRNYDVIVKWRWDSVMTNVVAFDEACNSSATGATNPPWGETLSPGFTFSTLRMIKGRVWVPDSVFFGEAKSMLEVFSPVETKFIELASELLREAANLKKEFNIECHWLFPKLIQMHNKSIEIHPQVLVYLLRENILNYDFNKILTDDKLNDLQRQWEYERDVSLGLAKSSNAF